MKYDMEADWITNLLCNYNCSYCFLRSDKEIDGVLSLEPKQYKDFFDRTGKTWMLHMSGGEPFIHNKAIDIMEEVTKTHYLSLNTNGTQTERIKMFTDKVPWDRVEYVHISAHLIERTKHRDWDKLYSNIKLLHDYGFFNTFASLVMEPAVVKQYPMLARDFKEYANCVLVPKLMRDEFYPKAYTVEERSLISSYINNIIGTYPDLAEKSFTINPLIERDYLYGFPEFRGHNCRAGVDFVKIDELGRIWRCEMKEQIGDIRIGELRLHKHSYTCNEMYCPSYCHKYSALTANGKGEYFAKS